MDRAEVPQGLNNFFKKKKKKNFPDAHAPRRSRGSPRTRASGARPTTRASGSRETATAPCSSSSRGGSRSTPVVPDRDGARVPEASRGMSISSRAVPPSWGRGRGARPGCSSCRRACTLAGPDRRGAQRDLPARVHPAPRPADGAEPGERPAPGLAPLREHARNPGVLLAQQRAVHLHRPRSRGRRPGDARRVRGRHGGHPGRHLPRTRDLQEADDRAARRVLRPQPDQRGRRARPGGDRRGPRGPRGGRVRGLRRARRPGPRSERPGGQAGSSSRIENYLGFPMGISGRDLANSALVQAEKFGAELAVARTAIRFSCDRRPTSSIWEAASSSGGARRSSRRACSTESPRSPISRASRASASTTARRRSRRICARTTTSSSSGGGNSAGQAAVFLSQGRGRVHVSCAARGSRGACRGISSGASRRSRTSRCTRGRRSWGSRGATGSSA